MAAEGGICAERSIGVGEGSGAGGGAAEDIGAEA